MSLMPVCRSMRFAAMRATASSFSRGTERPLPAAMSREASMGGNAMARASFASRPISVSSESAASISST